MSGDDSVRQVGLKISRARTFAVFLILLGAIVIAIQTYVYVTFDDYYDLVDTSTFQIPNLFLLCNVTALASGSLSFLTGLVCLCCITPKRSSSALKLTVFFNVLVAIIAVVAIVFVSFQADEINPDSNCSIYSSSINCSLWFGLEVGVAALSGTSFVVSLALIIIISTGLRASRRHKKKSKNHVQAEAVDGQQRSSVFVVGQQLVHVEELEPIPEEVVEVSEESRRQSVQHHHAPNVGEEEIPYMEQLKSLSREELERRLEEHFQHQFLEELRGELARRNLLQEQSNSEDIISASSADLIQEPTTAKTTVGSSSTGQPPRPDYDLVLEKVV